MMSDADGFTVAKKIREHPELSSAALIMLSSVMPAGAAARCRELHVAGYLMKPVSQPELLDGILTALGGKSKWMPKGYHGDLVSRKRTADPVG